MIAPRIAIIGVAALTVSAAIAIALANSTATPATVALDQQQVVAVAAAAMAPSAAPARTALPHSSVQTPKTFEQFIEQFVALGRRGRSAVDDDDMERTRAVQAQAEELWDELHREIRRPFEHALRALDEADRPADSFEQQVARRLYLRMVRTGLQAEHERSTIGGHREVLDELVSGLLGRIPRDAESAVVFAEMLVRKPYVSLAHESQVLDIAAAAAETDYLAPIATDLLLTLWRNLESSGARGSDQLAGLALLFKDEANPAQRLAALKHLLGAQGGRYRGIVLQDVLRSHDQTAARELAMAAAIDLEPQQAVTTLGQLVRIAGVEATPAFMALAERDSGVLQRTYDQRLAQNREPAFRAELVTGAGFAGDAAGIELARNALSYDPDPEVRARAVFVLTAEASAALGEDALTSALDDPLMGRDPRRLGQLVLAIENLGRAGEINAVDRVARRILARPELGEHDRNRLEAYLKEILPR